ncbi:MAG: release factor glutamine methyltransferase [Lentimonas sp.]|jgi:release factor glutamine methyltransferase
MLLISEALNLAKNSLKKQGIDSFSIDSLLLLCFSLSCSKEKIIFNPNLELDLEAEKKFLQALQQRESRQPMSHILGKREFFGNDFIVNSNVLDPRPDSESLIEVVLKLFPNKNQPLEILELGVGSACLVATILKYFPESGAIGIDISQKALETAQKNIQNLNLQDRVKLLQSNWFENLDSSKRFDLIISNPPYIKTSDIELLQDEVRKFEPRKALDGGIDGLDCYRIIAKKAVNFLKDSAFLLLEIGAGQEKEIAEIFKENNLKLIQEKKDLSGIIRALLFCK